MLLLLTAHWSTARPSSLVTRSAIRSRVSDVVALCRSLLASAALKAAIAWPVARRWASRLSVPWVASFPSSARDIRRSFCSARTRVSVGRTTSVWYELERRTRRLPRRVLVWARPMRRSSGGGGDAAGAVWAPLVATAGLRNGWPTPLGAQRRRLPVGARGPGAPGPPPRPRRHRDGSPRLRRCRGC